MSFEKPFKQKSNEEKPGIWDLEDEIRELENELYKINTDKVIGIYEDGEDEDGEPIEFQVDPDSIEAEENMIEVRRFEYLENKLRDKKNELEGIKKEQGL